MQEKCRLIHISSRQAEASEVDKKSRPMKQLCIASLIREKVNHKRKGKHKDI